MKQIVKTLTIAFAAVLLASLGAQLFSSYKVQAAQTPNRSLTLSTSEAAATNVTYTVGFTIAGSYNLGSVAIEFCEEDPLPDQPCTLPQGMDISAATLGAQTGVVGFNVVGGTATRIILGRAPAGITPVPVTFTLQNITNPDTANHTYFARIYTYTSNNGSGFSVDDGGLAFSTANRLTISTEVPPYIQFCVAQVITGLDCSSAAGYLVDLGEFSRLSPKSAEAQMLVATNAAYGAGITVSGTTLQSGNNTIPAMAAPSGHTPGVSQFGINLRSNSSPNIGEDPVGPGVAAVAAGYNTPNQYKFATGDTVASTSTTTDLRKFTVSFVTNINQNQAPGVYSTTMAFICLANF
jgi:hypothetical protein